MFASLSIAMYLLGLVLRNQQLVTVAVVLLSFLTWAAMRTAHGDVAAIKQDHGIDCHLAHTNPGACQNRVCLHGEPSAQRLKARMGNVEARACIESTRPTEGTNPAPFVLSTGCEIPFKTPVENIKALARAARAGF